MAVAKESEFEFWGFVLVMLAAVMSGFRWSMTQILLQVGFLGVSYIFSICMVYGFWQFFPVFNIVYLLYYCYYYFYFMTVYLLNSCCWDPIFHSVKRASMPKSTSRKNPMVSAVLLSWILILAKFHCYKVYMCPYDCVWTMMIRYHHCKSDTHTLASRTVSIIREEGHPYTFNIHIYREKQSLSGRVSQCFHVLSISSWQQHTHYQTFVCFKGLAF